MEALKAIIQGLKSRWMMAVASFFILSFAGSNYIFGIYSQTIKTTLGYDQETIDTLAFFKDLGANVGIIAGLINELSAPWVVLTVGSAMNLTGYLMIWLSVSGKVAKPAVWQMYFYQCIGGSSMTFINTGVIVTCVKNFPRGRGLVIGLLKGFVGLSGAIMTQIYEAVYGVDEPSSLIFLAATLPTTVTLLLMSIIRPLDSPKEKNEIKNFYVFLSMAMALAGFLMVSILLENLVTLPRRVIQVFAAITILIIFVPLVVVIRSQLHKPDQCNAGQGHELGSRFSDLEKKIELPASCGYSSKDMINSAGAVEISVVTEGTKSATEQNDRARSINPKSSWPQRGEDHTICQALMSADLWILFLATVCGLGSTITAIDNMGQIGKSLQYSSVSISTFVSLFSIWNFLGRVGSGCLSEILLQKYSIPRPVLLSLVLAIASVGHLLIAFPLPGSLYIASILIGMCLGAQWPLIFSIISELFGLRHFAILYNVGASASPVGAYLFSVRVAGFFYDKHAQSEHESSTKTYDHKLTLRSEPSSSHVSHIAAPSPTLIASANLNDLICNGKGCFHITFLIMAAISILGCGIAALLMYRTRQFYKQDIYGKFNTEQQDLKASDQPHLQYALKHEAGNDDKLSASHNKVPPNILAMSHSPSSRSIRSPLR
eukprot:Gb_41719 [translate_table: standard]